MSQQVKSTPTKTSKTIPNEGSAADLQLKRTIDNISIDLNALSSESKKKFNQVKEASELCALKLRQINNLRSTNLHKSMWLVSFCLDWFTLYFAVESVVRLEPRNHTPADTRLRNQANQNRADSAQLHTEDSRGQDTKHGESGLERHRDWREWTFASIRIAPQSLLTHCGNWLIWIWRMSKSCKPLYCWWTQTSR